MKQCRKQPAPQHRPGRDSAWVTSSISGERRNGNRFCSNSVAVVTALVWSPASLLIHAADAEGWCTGHSPDASGETADSTRSGIRRANRRFAPTPTGDGKLRPYATCVARRGRPCGCPSDMESNISRYWSRPADVRLMHEARRRTWLSCAQEQASGLLYEAMVERTAGSLACWCD